MTSSDQATTDASSTVSSRSAVVIARDGERRREDYESSPGVKVSRLELPGATFLIYHAQKLYTKIKQDKSASSSAAARPNDFELQDVSPDKLINESRAESRYENLGTEKINGRAATKYRVTTTGSRTDAAQQPLTTETVVWIDEALGMMIRSETTLTGGAAGASKYTVELQDIALDVDAALFALPQGYKQVEYKELNEHLLKEANNLPVK